jgi:hypothetical protein
VKDPVWGVIIDYRAESVEGGVPALWDGWYADRADAEQMRDHFQEKVPDRESVVGSASRVKGLTPRLRLFKKALDTGVTLPYRGECSVTALYSTLST